MKAFVARLQPKVTNIGSKATIKVTASYCNLHAPVSFCSEQLLISVSLCRVTA